MVIPAARGAQPGKRAFVSYSRRDRDYVRGLVEELRAAGLDVWVDFADVLPTAEWMAEIERGIRASENLLFVVSPDSVASPTCLAELAHAAEHGKRIVPVRHREVPPAELPAGVREIQWVPGSDAAEIVRWIETTPERVHDHTRVLTRAWEWNERGRPRAPLLRGTDLRRAEDWLTASDTAGDAPQPTDLQREFLRASRRAQQQRRTAGVTAGALLLAAAVVAGLLQADAAAAERSRRLAGLSADVVADQLDTALLYGSRALRESDTPAARSALLAAVRSVPQLTDLLRPEPLRPEPMPPVSELTGAALARSPDGSLVAVSREAGLVDVIGTADGRIRHRLPAGGAALAFSPDGRELAMNSGVSPAGSTIWFADLATGTVSEPLPVPRDPAAPVIDGNNLLDHKALTYSPDGSRLVVSVLDTALQVWDRRTRAWTGPLLRTPEAVSAVVFSPDGRSIATGDAAGDVQLWDGATGAPTGTFPSEPGAGRGIKDLAFDPAGRLLAGGTARGDVHVWDTGTRTERAGMTLPPGAFAPVDAVEFSPDGRWLVTSGSQGMLVVETAGWGALGGWLGGPEFAGTGIGFRPDGAIVWGIRADGALGSWRPAGPGPLGRSVTPPQDAGGAVAFGADGTLAAADPDGTAVVGGRELHHEIGGALPEEHELGALAVSGTTVVSAAEDGSVVRWDAATGRLLERIETGDDSTAVALSANGDRLATATFGDRIQVHDLGSGALLVDVPEGEANTRSIALSRDGGLVAAGSEDGTVTFVDVASGQVLGVVAAHDEQYVWALAFSPDGAALVSVGHDGTFVGWDVADRVRSAGPVDPHIGSLHSVAFDPAGRLFAVSGEEDRVVLVDAATATVVGVPLVADVAGAECPARPCSPIEALAFSPDGTTLAAGTRSDGVVLWDVDPASWHRWACARAGRDLSAVELERADLAEGRACG